MATKHKNKFKYKKDCIEYCETHCPKPWNHDSRDAALWVSNAMQDAYDLGNYRDGDWIRDWSLKYQIDYDNALTRNW